MNTVLSLIDKAAEVCGSYAALAERIGVDRQRVNALKTGKQQMTPEVVALLGDVLELPGVEVQRLAALAVVENPKNSEKAEVLRKAFFGCRVCALALCGVITASDGISSSADAVTMTALSMQLASHTMHWRAFLMLLKRSPRTRKHHRSTAPA